MFMKTRPAYTISNHLPARFVAALAFSLCSIATTRAADEYWRTDGTTGGTWTSTFWNIGSANATGGTGWTAANNAVFSADSTLTFATATVGDVTVSANKTVTITAGGTLTLGGIRTFDVGSGATLTWTSQTQSTAAGNEGAGIVKNGAGTLNWGAGPGSNARFDGGFTLNAGTIIVSGDNALSSGALVLNGGILQSSGTRAFTSTSMTIGGDFALAGTGNSNWDLATTIALGTSTRTITNSTTSGSRQFRGLISGGSGAGLTFAGTGSAQIYIGNTGNTFTGPVAITGGEVVFNGNGALGATTSITLDGGRLTTASMDTTGATSALTAATISSDKNVYVGSTAGTSISVQGATGVLTYNGVIADKASTTGAWAKQGAGMLSLGGVSTYTGATAINNGTVKLTTGNDRLPTGTVVSLGQAASSNLGTLDLNGNSQQIAGLNSTAGINAGVSKNTVTSATAATLTIGGAGAYSYGAGTAANSGTITGALAVLKTGLGSQTFGEANTYTGGTTISGGILATGNSGALGTGGVLISGGTLDVGGSSVGSLALGSTANFTMTTGTLKLTLGTSFDQITGQSGGTFSFTGGTLALDVSDPSFSYASTYQVLTGFGTSATPTGLTFTGLTGYTAALDNTGLLSFSVAAVPEPSTYGAICAGLALAGAVVYRRRKGQATRVD